MGEGFCGGGFGEETKPKAGGAGVVVRDTGEGGFGENTKPAPERGERGDSSLFFLPREGGLAAAVEEGGRGATTAPG